jgi:hypothetical protein
MLCNANELTAVAIQKVDGENGYVKDLYFDDDARVICYFVVEARSLFSSRNVLLSPITLHEPHWKGRMLKIALTLGRARGSPSVDFGQSVTSQHEAQYLADSGYHVYWICRGLWGDSIAPSSVVPDYIARRDAIYSSSAFDPDAVLDRIRELRLHEHYSRMGNWTRDEALEGPQ